MLLKIGAYVLYDVKYIVKGYSYFELIIYRNMGKYGCLYLIVKEGVSLLFSVEYGISAMFFISN